MFALPCQPFSCRFLELMWQPTCPLPVSKLLSYGINVSIKFHVCCRILAKEMFTLTINFLPIIASPFETVCLVSWTLVLPTNDLLIGFLCYNQCNQNLLTNDLSIGFLFITSATTIYQETHGAKLVPKWSVIPSSHISRTMDWLLYKITKI